MDTIAYVKKVSNIRKVPRDLPVILAAGTKTRWAVTAEMSKSLFVTYSQAFFKSLGLPQALIPTLANGVNIVVQVVLSYPAMKFWIMPK